VSPDFCSRWLRPHSCLSILHSWVYRCTLPYPADSWLFLKKLYRISTEGLRKESVRKEIAELAFNIEPLSWFLLKKLEEWVLLKSML
jgi:hypothetical protein